MGRPCLVTIVIDDYNGCPKMKLDIQIDEQDLPVLSTVATQSLDLLKDAKVTNHKLEDLICQDPALAARVLRSANSPVYSGRMQTTTISDAIFRLGMNNLRNVIVIAATGEFFNNNDANVQYLWDHSVSTAMAANFITDYLNYSQLAEVFMAGLLHDIGKLIVLRQHPDVYSPLVSQALESGCPLHKLEEETFNYFTHMSVGGLVVRKWKLPDSIAEAARFHHDVEQEIPICINHERIVCVVALANTLSRLALANTPLESLPEFEGLAYVQTLRLTDKKIREIAKGLVRTHSGPAHRPELNAGCAWLRTRFPA